MDVPRWIDSVSIIFLDKATIERFREAVARAESDTQCLVGAAVDLLKAIDGNAERCIAEAERAIRDVARWAEEFRLWREADGKEPS